MAFLRGERELNLFLWDGDTLHVWGGRRKKEISFWGKKRRHIFAEIALERKARAKSCTYAWNNTMGLEA